MGVAHDVCADCVGTTGKLCSRCAPSVLPQLARNIGWLKLMGAAEVEQKALQDAEDAAVIKAKRRNERKSRRGYVGLARAIARPSSRVALPPRRGEVAELNFDHNDAA